MGAAAPRFSGRLSYPVRTPAWKLTYQGLNITGDVTPMMTEITWTRKEQHFSDAMEVTLEDRDKRFQGPWFPVRGDVMTLQMGYAGEQTSQAATFQIDELELKGPPDTFHLKCIATGITPSIRTHRSQSYESKTLVQVATAVAASHGMTVVGAPQDVNVTWERLTQRHETDLNFLHRLAIAHNYDFSIRGSKLIFFSRTQLEQLPPILSIDRTQTKTFEFKVKTGRIYQSATVAYQNPQRKELIGAQYIDPNAPTGDDRYIVARCENAAQAKLKAQSALHDANMLEVTGRLALEGEPLLMAGVNIAISGFGQFSGTYLIRESKHKLERSSGYSTEIDLRRL
jgi:phage protein D